MKPISRILVFSILSLSWVGEVSFAQNRMFRNFRYPDFHTHKSFEELTFHHPAYCLNPEPNNIPGELKALQSLYPLVQLAHSKKDIQVTDQVSQGDFFSVANCQNHKHYTADNVMETLESWTDRAKGDDTKGLIAMMQYEISLIDTPADGQSNKLLILCNPDGELGSVAIYQLQQDSIYLSYVVSDPAHLRFEEGKPKGKGAGKAAMKELVKIALFENKKEIKVWAMGNSKDFYKPLGFKSEINGQETMILKREDFPSQQPK